VVLWLVRDCGLVRKAHRNFELRREFAADLDAAPIKVTSVLNGAFADMLTGTAPMIAFDRRKVMFWSSADQILEFTTKDDVARMVALVALDADAPRRGDRRRPRHRRSVAQTMSELTGTEFTLQFAGTTGTLSLLAKDVRRFSTTTDAPFPAWWGMQYFVSMFSGQAQLRHVDNDRYGDHDWTSVRDVLAAHLNEREAAPTPVKWVGRPESLTVRTPVRRMLCICGCGRAFGRTDSDVTVQRDLPGRCSGRRIACMTSRMREHC
jgi:hypothetical protein